jgi:hypothetical protein
MILSVDARCAGTQQSADTGMNQDDVERIARRALKDLGADLSELSVQPVDGRPDQWRIEIGGAAKPLTISCGRGSTAQWVRQQICEKYLAQS